LEPPVPLDVVADPCTLIDSLGKLIAGGAYELEPTEFTPTDEETVRGTLSKGENGELLFYPAEPDKEVQHE
jgi:hypothetical protein